MTRSYNIDSNNVKFPLRQHWSIKCFSFVFQAGVFMGFSITSAVLGGLIIYCYGAVTATISERHRRSTYGYYWYREQYSDADLAISIMILILGITEFVIGIWAAVCCCLMKPCTCCAPNPVQQVRISEKRNQYSLRPYAPFLSLSKTTM